MLCEHCGQVEREVGAPCPSCKFQPYNEANGVDLVAEPNTTTICPECGTQRANPSDPCERCKELDVCPTPPKLALAICRRVVETTTIGNQHESSPPPRILEPSAGDGAFVRAARRVWPRAEITAVEIRPQCRAKLLAAGANRAFTQALEYEDTAERRERCDLVIGNPPFSLAEAHIRLLLGAMRPGAVLAFLLRLGFYESHTRIPFWNEFPEDSFAPVVPRPGFKLNAKGKKGTDSQSYGLFIWTKRNHHDGESVLDGRALPIRDSHIIWRDPSPRGRKKRNEVKSSSSSAPEPEPEPEVFDLE